MLIAGMLIILCVFVILVKPRVTTFVKTVQDSFEVYPSFSPGHESRGGGVENVIGEFVPESRTDATNDLKNRAQDNSASIFMYQSDTMNPMEHLVIPGYEIVRSQRANQGIVFADVGTHINRYKFKIIPLKPGPWPPRLAVENKETGSLIWQDIEPKNRLESSSLYSNNWDIHPANLAYEARTPSTFPRPAALKWFVIKDHRKDSKDTIESCIFSENPLVKSTYSPNKLHGYIFVAGYHPSSNLTRVSATIQFHSGKEIKYSLRQDGKSSDGILWNHYH